MEEESGSVGRLGRFNRRFGAAAAAASTTGGRERKKDGVSDGGVKEVGMGEALDDVGWFEQMAALTGGAGEGSTPKKKERK